ncbi:protein SENESCENCE-ASSOCIATED GENE 21, mitochondrial-like [Gastrolobium bilobum]|uniref:protein SENESCENCE-ASSOCIATED GENE 21, mitochondrial-like n=1 Tax=Gastrolobium bilobum TaxID=150636 RepID=UPI002AB2BD02|nr:protein SENESCENCE-ASSOCIATED GENE 21, mitochondrial-like [Gastrolobium bilobum]
MANVPVNPILLLRKRSCAVVAESLRLQTAATTVVKSNESESASANASSASKKDEIFWMRDPKTGNWMPENRFGEVDSADLREKFLPKKQNL